MLKFEISNEHDINKMSALVDVMSEYLFLLSEDENNLLQNNSLNFYLNSLVDGQRDKLTGGTKSGSWCVAPDDLMDSDARVDFIFKPTYLAVATLSLAKIDYPLITNSINNYDENHESVFTIRIVIYVITNKGKFSRSDEYTWGCLIRYDLFDILDRKFNLEDLKKIINYVNLDILQ